MPRFRRHKNLKNRSFGPFQSECTLIHTPRTRWLCPGCLLRKPPVGTIDAQSVGRFRFGSAFETASQRFNAGWSSPVARQAHNLKVIGSNPIPATKFGLYRSRQENGPHRAGHFCLAMNKSPHRSGQFRGQRSAPSSSAEPDGTSTTVNVAICRNSCVTTSRVGCGARTDPPSSSLLGTPTRSGHLPTVGRRTRWKVSRWIPT